MKKIALFLLAFYCGQAKCQQTPLPCNWNLSWDWLNSNSSNWDAQVQGTVAHMGSPFIYGNSTDIVNLVDADDYHPTQGWVLLMRNFGCIGQLDVPYATPYFMLYNKFRGVIRLFIYVANTNVMTDASLVVKWNSPTQNNSLLTNSNTHAKSNEIYPLASNNEQFVNYLNEYPNSGGWIVTDIQTNFYEFTNKDKNSGQPVNLERLKFAITPTSKGDVSLHGEFSFSTQSASAKNAGTPVSETQNPNLLDYTNQAKEYLGKAPKTSDLTAGFDQIASSVDNIDESFCNDFTTKLHNANYSLQNGPFKKYLLGVADVAEALGGGLGIAATVLEFFMGKSNTSASNNQDNFIQPTISKGSMTLQGTIATSSSPTDILMQVPGTGHTLANGNEDWIGMPLYDCPLGVVALQEAPTINVKSWTEPENTGFSTASIDFSTYLASCDPTNQYNQTIIGHDSYGIAEYRRTWNGVSPKIKNVKSYQVSGDIKLAINDAAGVFIESTKAALFFEITSNGSIPNMDLFRKTTDPMPSMNPNQLLPQPTTSCDYNWNSSTGNSIVLNSSTSYQNGIFINYANDLLNRGILKLSYYDKTNGLHKFQTPFIDINKFKNTAITIEEGTNVYLKLLITLKPVDPNADQTPIVYLATYEIPSNKIINIAGNVPYSNTCEQQAELLIPTLNTTASIIGNASLASIWISNNQTNIVVRPSTLTEYKAEQRVQFTSGFSTDIHSLGGRVYAHITPDNTGSCVTGLNALQTTNYFTGCNPNPFIKKNYMINGDSQDVDMSTNDVDMTLLKMYIAPNPNNGIFKLLFNQKTDLAAIDIYDISGNLVIHKDIKDENMIQFSINENLNPGVYFINCEIKNGVQLKERFIIK